MIRFSVLPAKPEGGKDRFPGVDALKGFAILMVILYHAGGVLILPDTLHGELGVDIFLLLSGYLLSLSSSESPTREFLSRRFIRIFPTYWMALALFAVLGTTLRHCEFTRLDILLHVVGLHATVRGANFSDINDSFWYITTILVLYLVFLAMRRWVRDLPLVLGVGGLMTLLCLLPFPQFGSLAARLPGFFIGVCLGQLRRGGEFRLQPGFFFTAGVVSFVVLEWQGMTGIRSPFTAIAITAVFALIYRLLQPWRVGRLLLGPIEFLGVYSYEIYLFHQPLIREYNYWFQQSLLRRNPSRVELVWGMLIGFILAVGVSVTAAAIARRRRPRAWALALAGAMLLALVAGAGPFMAKAGERFTGAVRIPIPPTPVMVPAGSLWEIAAPANRSLARWSGPLRLVVELPSRLGAPAEPLVVTGRIGRGDFLGVIRVDGQHVRFICDHWGYFSLTSAEIPLGKGPQHVIELLLGSLLPPTGSPWYDAHAPAKWMARRLYIAIDGREAFNRDMDFFPAAPTEAFVGVNPIGGSTTVPRFAGRILRIENLSPQLFMEKVGPAAAR